MNQKYYQVLIRLTTDERIEVVVEAENVAALAESFTGTRFSFINKVQPEMKSFTIFSAHILKLEYTATTVLANQKHRVYTVLAGF